VTLLDDRLNGVDEHDLTLKLINDVRTLIGRPTLAEIPEPTGRLASQTSLGEALGCSVFRMRQTNTRPIAITKDEDLYKALHSVGCIPTTFSGYPSFRPNGPRIYEVTLPDYAWEFVVAT
jgi:hypothetical protein